MNGQNTLRCFISALSDCGYLPDQKQRNLVVDPIANLNAPTYEYLSAQGFRRNGNHLYRPYCPECNACTPIRINLEKFSLSRSLRRNLKQNQDLEVKLEATSDDHEFYDLFIRYVRQRHDQSAMSDMTVEDYRGFLFCDWLDTRLFTARLNGELMSATLIDFLPNGVSAVYTFYEPSQVHRGLGTFAIIKLVELCQKQNMDFVNLGYWIENAPTMQYKTKFKGIELAIDSVWTAHKKPETTASNPPSIVNSSLTSHGYTP